MRTGPRRGARPAERPTRARLRPPSPGAARPPGARFPMARFPATGFRPRSPFGARAAFAGAGQHEEQIRKAIEPGEEILTGHVALVDALNNLALRPADDRTGVVECRRKPVLAWDDESSLDRCSLLDLLE